MDARGQVTNAGELSNASQFPRMYYARHMQPGVCRYVHSDGVEEIVLLKVDTLQKMAPSFVGKPVYVFHQKVDLDNLKDEAAGYVTASFYNELDGWLWVQFIMIDDSGHDSIQGGWSVSNAYIPDESGAGGSWNNNAYHREITTASFTHLAIVPDPRYEDACIFTPEAYKVYQDERRVRLNELRNSKSTEGNKFMLKFFKNEKKEVAASDVDADTMVELTNGKSMKLTDMVAAVEKREKTNAIKDATIMVNGKSMTVAELSNAYTEMCKEKENEADDKDEKENDADGTVDLNMIENASDDGDEDDDKKEKENETDTDQPEGDKGDKEVKNSKAAEEAAAAAAKKVADKKHFDELKNAKDKAMPVRRIEISVDQVQRGKDRYGSDATTH